MMYLIHTESRTRCASRGRKEPEKRLNKLASFIFILTIEML